MRIRGTLKTFTRAASLFAALVAMSSSVRAQSSAALSRDWNQRFGNAANTSACDVEPIYAPPVDAWRLRYESILAGPIVVNDRAIFVAREAKDRRVLFAVKPATGEMIARNTLDRGGDSMEIVGDGDYLAVLEPGRVRPYVVTGSNFKAQKSLEIDWRGVPSVHRGRLFVKVGPLGYVDPSLTSIELATGKKTSLAGCFGKPAFFSKEADSPDASVRGVDSNSNLLFDSGAGYWTSGHFPSVTSLAHGVVVGFRVNAQSTHCFVWFEDEPENSVLVEKGQMLPIDFVDAPAVFDSHFVGYIGKGELLKFDPVTRQGPILLDRDPTQKSKPGAPSIARDVLYLGNWAIDLGSGRVLWRRDDLEPLGRAIPAGDGIVIVRTAKHELVGLVDPKVSAAAAAVASAPSAAKGTKPVAPEAAKPRPKLPSADAAFAESLAGDEFAIVRAFEAALQAEFVDVLLGLFDRYAQFKLFEECRRLLGSAKQLGLDDRKADELSARIAGKPSSTADNAALQKKKILTDEQAATAKHVERMLAAADWCEERKFARAASVLVGAARASGAADAIAFARALRLMPAEFPWAKANVAPERWLDWAAALLPSDARFLARDDPAWQRVRGSPFAKEAIALSTKNILMFAREFDATTIGACLTRSEAAVRALDGLLGPSPDGKTRDGLLEVRLHATREQYLADKIEGVEVPSAWTAGVYSPREGVSRFYARHAQDEDDPLGRTLHHVLAHEITHHYVHQRWIGHESTLDSPGAWMVEGFAEFVSEQAVEVGRVGESLNDPTVPSLDISAALARERKLLSLDFLLGLDNSGVHTKLEDPTKHVPALRHSLKRRLVDQRGIFYAQSAALTFFVLRRRDDVARAGYVDLLRSHYFALKEPDPWKKLGFEDLASLERAFLEFLKGL